MAKPCDAEGADLRGAFGGAREGGCVGNVKKGKWMKQGHFTVSNFRLVTRMGNFRIHAKTRIKIVFCVSIPYINHVQTVTLIKKRGETSLKRKTS